MEMKDEMMATMDLPSFSQSDSSLPSYEHSGGVSEILDCVLAILAMKAKRHLKKVTREGRCRLWKQRKHQISQVRRSGPSWRGACSTTMSAKSR